MILPDSTRHAPTVAVLGQGFYDRNSQPQESAIKSLTPLLDRAVSELANNSGRFCICDYGCAEGRNSSSLMSHISWRLNERFDQPSILACRNDLPSNDFSSFRRSAEIVRKPNRLFDVVVGRSFFEQVLPSNSVNMGTSTTAIHWLSHKPAVKSHDNTKPWSLAARPEFAPVAASDWEQFLLHRSREIVTGGKLLITTLARQDAVSRCSPLELLQLAVTRFVKEGRIPDRHLHEFALPVYFRSKSELLAPLQPNKCLAKRYTVDVVNFKLPACPLYERFKETGDTNRFANDYTLFIRAFSESNIASQLFGEQCCKNDQNARIRSIDDFYGAVRELILANPHRFSRRVPHLQLLLTVR